MPKDSLFLSPESVAQVLQPDGALSQNLKGFESRKQQLEMARNVIDAYNDDGIALIEAGTGTGKSFAYLIPAIMWALQKGEKTVISTNTITLQEQLIHKDIPLVAKALRTPVKAVLVKGMRNYLCLRKLEEAKGELLLLPSEEANEVTRIDIWSQASNDGSKATLPFVPSSSVWDKVGAENDTCNKAKCPYYQQCPFFKARKLAEDAQILVVNHHLLFADLSLRNSEENYQDSAVLPFYKKVILDEAHHIEDVATEYFADHINRLELLQILGRLTSEKHGKSHGKIPLVKERLLALFPPQDAPKEVSSLLVTLNSDLPNTRRDLLTQIADTFDAYSGFLDSVKNRSSEDTALGENKLRIMPMHQTHPSWTNEMKPRTEQLINSIKRYVQMLQEIETHVKRLDNDRIKEQLKGVFFEITALCLRLLNACDLLDNFVMRMPPSHKVRWIESQNLRSTTNLHLVDAELDISKALVDYLFSKLSTVVLCSATLTTNKKFDFIRKRLGLTSENLKTKAITENTYESPFNFSKQALLAIPTDLPDPSSPQFTAAASEKIWQAVQASRGNAFVLFTSYSMMKVCHQALMQKLTDNRFHVLKQGDDNRQTLLERFKATDRSVLFGTDSFWEGVDVAGDALRCVIIVKLPFKVPTEPLIQARTEAIFAKGGDPFMEYSLPSAIVKFKQGVGRLIRNHKDRGCIVCLDPRLLTKGYGQQFLNSLPPCQQVFDIGQIVEQKMTDFYRKTHYLVKN